MTDSIVIVSARRTAIGSFQGQFAQAKSPDLGATAISAALADAGVDGADVSEVIMGCVLPAGVGQAPARQASLGAGLPVSTGCTTINKVCGSGMKAVMQGSDALLAGSADIVVAGGMESMTNAPYMAERGLRMGHAKFLDHMFFDGLQNPYDGQMMGQFGEQCVAKYGFTRDEQDAFSKASVERALKAIETDAGWLVGWFAGCVGFQIVSTSSSPSSRSSGSTRYSPLPARRLARVIRRQICA